MRRTSSLTCLAYGVLIICTVHANHATFLTVTFKTTISVAPLSLSVVGGSARLEQQPLQLFHNPLCCLPVPERLDRTFLPLSGYQVHKYEWQLAWISPDQSVGADRDGLGAFGVIAESSRYSPCIEAYSAPRP